MVEPFFDERANPPVALQNDHPLVGGCDGADAAYYRARSAGLLSERLNLIFGGREKELVVLSPR
jgi:hypothetical protein